MYVCKHCGYESDVEFKFCSKCGRPNVAESANNVAVQAVNNEV